MKTLQIRALIICSFVSLLSTCADTGPFYTFTSITVAPIESFITIGNSHKFRAIGTYSSDSDSYTDDNSSIVTWNSSNPEIATINTQGVATGIAAGTTNITASWTNGSGEALSGTSKLVVFDSVLLSIEVLPGNPIITLGTDTQFTAVGTYKDNSIIDMTKAVTWSSSTTSIASFSDVPTSNGKAISHAVGTAIITATDIATNISGTTALIVTN